MERHYYWFLNGGTYDTAVDNNFGIISNTIRLLDENQKVYEAELGWIPSPGRGTPEGVAYQPRTVKVRHCDGYAGRGWLTVHKYADEERAEMARRNCVSSRAAIACSKTRSIKSFTENFAYLFVCDATSLAIFVPIYFCAVRQNTHRKNSAGR